MSAARSSVPAGGEDAVQDAFLARVREAEAPVTVFLVNGVKLQGVIARHDAATLLLRRDGHVQLIYKHAISTIMPQGSFSADSPSAALPPDSMEGAS